MAPKSGIMGYNQDLFQVGQQLGQQPNDHPIWQQPFQDPYSGGGNPFFGAPEGGGETIPPGGADYPIGPNSWDQMQQQQPMMQQPPSPKQDLNHPFWSQVGNYLGSEGFKDSLLAGVIAGQMAYDPQGALRLAVQFKEQRDRRKWQAQQNEQQQAATAENTKMRAEAQKAVKEQATFDKRVAKIQAGLQAGNVPPEIVQQYIADKGPPDETNIGDYERDWALFQSQVKAKEKEKKEADKIFDQQRQVLAGIAKGEPVGKTPWDNNPDFMQTRAAAEILGKTRRDYNTNMMKQRQSISALTAQLKAADLKQKPAEGQVKSPKYKQALVELADANKDYDAIQNDIDTLAKGSKTPFGDIDYTQEIASKQEALVAAQTRLQGALDSARTLASGKDIDLMTPPEPKKGLTSDDLQRLIEKRKGAANAAPPQ